MNLEIQVDHLDRDMTEKEAHTFKNLPFPWGEFSFVYFPVIFDEGKSYIAK